MLQNVLGTVAVVGGYDSDTDLTDRLNAFVTVNVLIGFSVLISWKQFGGKPIECLTPDLFSSAWEQYTENYCWAQDTYFLPFDEALPQDIQERENKRISYYQWVPFFLLIEAACFRLPSLIWKYLAHHSGIKIHDIVKLAVDPKNVEPAVKKANIDSLTIHLQNALRFHRRVLRKQASPHKFLRFLNIPYSAFFVTTMYLITKLAYLVNVAVQLYAMNCRAEVDRFVNRYLKLDGVFVLRMITMHSGVIFGTDLILSLWKAFYGIEDRYRHPPTGSEAAHPALPMQQQLPTPTPPITDKDRDKSDKEKTGDESMLLGFLRRRRKAAVGDSPPADDDDNNRRALADTLTRQLLDDVDRKGAPKADDPRLPLARGMSQPMGATTAPYVPVLARGTTEDGRMGNADSWLAAAQARGYQKEPLNSSGASKDLTEGRLPIAKKAPLDSSEASNDLTEGPLPIAKPREAALPMARGVPKQQNVRLPLTTAEGPTAVSPSRFARRMDMGPAGYRDNMPDSRNPHVGQTRQQDTVDESQETGF